MTSLERLIERLKGHEGWRAVVYDDATGKPIGPGTLVKGNPTIGYGWALNKLPMTKRLGEVHLRETAQDVVFALHHRLPWVRELDEVRLTALYELGYNLGLDGLLGFPKMLDALRRRRWAEAGDELIDSKWAREDVGPARSSSIKHMIVTGTWPGEG
jgi:lysozyme